MDFSKLTELDKGFRPAFCDGGAGTECCDMGCTASREQSELTAERAAKAQGALTDERAAFEVWAGSMLLFLKRDEDNVEVYWAAETHAAWLAWKASARLAPSIQALPVVASAPDFKKIAQAVFDQVTESFISDPDPDTRDYYAGKLAGATEMKAALFKVAPAAAQPEAKEAPAHAKLPTDLSKHLRDFAGRAGESENITISKKYLGDAADEIDRYYGGMMAWKKTAEAKDAAAGNSQDAKDAARWRFMMRAGDDENSPEMQAIERLGSDVLEDDRPNSVQMVELIDAAMAAAPSPAEGDHG